MSVQNHKRWQPLHPRQHRPSGGENTASGVKETPLPRPELLDLGVQICPLVGPPLPSLHSCAGCGALNAQRKVYLLLWTPSAASLSPSATAGCQGNFSEAASRTTY